MMPDAVNSLLQMYPSSIIYEHVEREDGSKELVFGLREELKRIKQLGPTPEVEFRPGVIDEYWVMLMPVFIRLGPLSRESLFLMWINGHEPEGMETLRLLASQPEIRLEVYAERAEPELSLTIPNPDQQFIANVILDMQAARPWTPQQFETAKVLLYQRRPTAMDIWWSI
jgi:hypothetical protein